MIATIKSLPDASLALISPGPSRTRKSATKAVPLGLARASRLERQIAKLRLQHALTGSVDVSCRGPEPELGRWVKTLLRRYSRVGADSRLAWIEENAPDMAVQLRDLANLKKRQRSEFSAPPAWLSACWVFAFLAARRRIPSRRSGDLHEAAGARWLASIAGIDDQAPSDLSPELHGAAVSLARLARQLDSDNAGVVAEARLALRDWSNHPLYDALAHAALTSHDILPPGLRRRMRRRQRTRKPFWPTEAQWRANFDDSIDLHGW